MKEYISPEKFAERMLANDYLPAIFGRENSIRVPELLSGIISCMEAENCPLYDMSDRLDAVKYLEALKILKRNAGIYTIDRDAANKTKADIQKQMYEEKKKRDEFWKNIEGLF